MDGSHGDNGDYDTNYHLLSITANSKKTEEYLYLKFSKYYMSNWFLSFVCLFLWVFFFFNVLHFFESWLLHPQNSLFSSRRTINL